MEAHVRRMVTEYIELGDKLHDATIFTAKVKDGMELPKGMTRDDFDLLDKQRVAMDEYHRILHERLLRAGVDMSKEPELSFGQKLVGADFNPSGDDKVKQLKSLAAQMADIVERHKVNDGVSEITYVDSFIRLGAINRILDAQMWAVKHITNKH